MRISTDFTYILYMFKSKESRLISFVLYLWEYWLSFAWAELEILCLRIGETLIMARGWWWRMAQDFILDHVLPFWISRVRGIYCKPYQLPSYRVQPDDCRNIWYISRPNQAWPYVALFTNTPILWIFLEALK